MERTRLPEVLWPLKAEPLGRQDDHPMGTMSAELLHWMAEQLKAARVNPVTGMVKLKLKAQDREEWLKRVEGVLSLES